MFDNVRPTFDGFGGVMMRRLMERLLDWLWRWIGMDLRMDGDLVTPRSADDPWWYDEVW